MADIRADIGARIVGDIMRRAIADVAGHRVVEPPADDDDASAASVADDASADDGEPHVVGPPDDGEPPINEPPPDREPAILAAVLRNMREVQPKPIVVNQQLLTMEDLDKLVDDEIHYLSFKTFEAKLFLKRNFEAKRIF